VVEFNPSWHHNYASLGFWTPLAASTAMPHYPATRPDLVPLTAALHALANDAAARSAFGADRQAFCAGRSLPDAHAALLAAADFPAMVALGVHPLVPFLARLALEREGHLLAGHLHASHPSAPTS
jgi:2,3-dihydroxyphenylpropionate 1,2-dioxygenase